jgi:hypothetical protein
MLSSEGEEICSETVEPNGDAPVVVEPLVSSLEI